MDLNALDLNTLATLWTAAARSNPEFHNALYNELQSRIKMNKNFSREYLFEMGSVKAKVLTIEFVPTSQAYLDYGSDVTVELVVVDELMELVNNYSAKPPVNTYGVMTAKILVKDELSQQEVNGLSPVKFHTQDVLRILYI